MRLHRAILGLSMHRQRLTPEQDRILSRCRTSAAKTPEPLATAWSARRLSQSGAARLRAAQRELTEDFAV